MPDEGLVKVGGEKQRKDGGGEEDHEKKCQSRGGKPRPGRESNDRSS